jgi:hypothetical protein
MTGEAAPSTLLTDAVGCIIDGCEGAAQLLNLSSVSLPGRMIVLHFRPDRQTATRAVSDACRGTEVSFTAKLWPKEKSGVNVLVTVQRESERPSLTIRWTLTAIETPPSPLLRHRAMAPSPRRRSASR